MKKKILYIDMDGVICCFETGVKALEPTMEWNREQVNKVCEANIRIFLTLPEIIGAKEALNELKDLFDIYFASVPMWNVPQSYTDKRLFIEKMFGSWVENKLILTHNKGLLKEDFIVDDRFVHGVDEFEGEHIHFGIEKFSNWEKVKNYLMERV